MKRVILSLAVVFTTLVGVVSCNKEKSENQKEVSISDRSDFLKSKSRDVKKNIIFELSEFNKNLSVENFSVFNEEFIQLFDKNLEIVKEKGVESFLIDKGFSKNEIDFLNFYGENKYKNNIYDLLSKEFPNFDKDNDLKVFQLIEVTNLLYDYYKISSPNRDIPWKCIAAIGGSLLASASFAFVPGPGWALGITLLSKAYATYTLIDTCNQARKEEDIKKYVENTNSDLDLRDKLDDFVKFTKEEYENFEKLLKESNP